MVAKRHVVTILCAYLKQGQYHVPHSQQVYIHVVRLSEINDFVMRSTIFSVSVFNISKTKTHSMQVFVTNKFISVSVNKQNSTSKKKKLYNIHCSFGTTLYISEVLNASMLGLISSHQGKTYTNQSEV